MLRFLALLVVCLVSAAHAEVATFRATGPGEALEDELAVFRETLREMAEVTEVAGSRDWFEETWDQIGAHVTDPKPFPAEPSSTRGAPGLIFRGQERTRGFLVSSPVASEQLARFGLPLVFIPHSEEKMFAPTGGTVFDITFQSPKNASVEVNSHAFGIVFVDVDTAGAASLTFYNKYDEVLLELEAEPSPAGLSFVGATFDQADLARVRVRAGNAAILGNRRVGPGPDGVVIDNIIYGLPYAQEPPFAIAMLLAVVLFGAVNAMRPDAA